ncbi:alpha/beta hydrolase-fold protein [Nocardia sp. NPDC052566]|uniref:alpha/beta hydrolase-fold protein n=1 Tax=Nocardia sp. NPDC052566 TaxID=3364330 RepID=UPI0037C96706
MRTRIVAALFGALLVVVAAVAPKAAADQENRTRTATVDGMPFTVLLPPDYENSGKRYPVLYLFYPGNGITARHSEGSAWLQRTELEQFTRDKDTIVVLPTQPELSFYLNARDGSCRGESQLMQGVIPYVDSTFRTIADGRHRALAGIAPGGLSAMYLAARYPDMFTAAASLSGEPDVFLGLGRAGAIAYSGIERVAVLSCHGNPLGPGLFGPLPSDEVWWRNANPPDLAPNFRGMSLFVTTGNGVPCDARDVADLAQPQEGPFTQPFQLTEPVVAQGSRGLLHGLDQARVPYRGGTDRCGMHTWRYWEQFLYEFWPQLADAFGTAKPRTFDYRRVDPEFSVWDWTFRADPARAPEFLDIRTADSTGLTLTGSGAQQVTTARYYPPGATMRVDDGIQIRAVVADEAGRLNFTVDLGTAHIVQQYRWDSPIDSAPGYFATRTVRISGN